MNGKFVISLDFELIWGMIDRINLESYRENILKGREAILRILELFDKYEIHATWAVVGILACSNKAEILKYSPIKKPNFQNNLSSSYSYMNKIGINEKVDPYCYGESLIRKIIKYPNQEIGSHTFSHYYCNEVGADLESFKEDLLASKKIIKEKFGIEMKSIIFPRNHVKNDYLKVAQQCKFQCYRSNPKIYSLKKNKIIKFYFKILRIIDTYFSICGENCFNETKNMGMGSTCASRFLRPYNTRFRFLEFYKIKRIKRQMRYAALNNRIFHLWWHPHNFGKNTEEMLKQLEDILIYYQGLKKIYQFKSYNMGELELNYEKRY